MCVCRYQTTYADDKHSLGDVLLAGAEVTACREELTFTIHGGKDHSFMIVKYARARAFHAHMCTYTGVH
jgi:hypothetical protein